MVQSGRLPDGARLHVVPWLRRFGKLCLPDWLAITVGRDIWAWRPLDEHELAHELCHVHQWRHHGLRFVARYLRASCRAWRAGGDAYRDNAFEVAARGGSAATARRPDPTAPSSGRAAPRRHP